MAKNPKSRAIRFDQFSEQLEEVGVSNLQEVQMAKDVSVYIRLGNSIDQGDADEFQARIRSSETSEDVAKVVLDYYPATTDPDEYDEGERGEAQWQTFTEHGGTADRLAALFSSATADQQERLGKLRPRRS